MSQQIIRFNDDSVEQLKDYIDFALPILRKQLLQLPEQLNAIEKKLNENPLQIVADFKVATVQLETVRQQQLQLLTGSFSVNGFFSQFIGTQADNFSDHKTAAFRLFFRYVALGVLGLIVVAILWHLTESTLVMFIVTGLSVIALGLSLMEYGHYRYYQKILQSIKVSNDRAFTDQDILHIVKKEVQLKKKYEIAKKMHFKEFETQKKAIEDKFDAQKKILKDQFEKDYAVASQHKQSELDKLKVIHQRIIDEAAIKLKRIKEHLNLFPETSDFEAFDWDSTTQLEKRIPLTYMRLGAYQLTFSEGDRNWIFPSFIHLLNANNVSIPFNNADQQITAKNIIHQIIARTLIAVPTGKLRIVGIDPRQLGNNFQHLLKLHDSIHGGKIWSDASDVQKQLQQLVLNIEHVVQDLLRGEYSSVDAYNQKLKSLKEPHRLLVIFDFPTGFSDESIKLLLKIMENGPKAGVNVLLTIDKTAKMPYGSNLEPFLRLPIAFQLDPWDKQDYQYDRHIEVEKIVEWTNKCVENIEKESLRYEDYLPTPANWWKGNTADTFNVPIGRKRGEETLNFKFDNQTSASAMLIGKPGSGKSNLLHILITNALMHYEPTEIEFHLVDFKGGVEFVAYAEKNLPHIHTIAIESNREFGLSVLQELEKKLSQRENLFRDKKQRKISEYRAAFPNEPMPRIVLIIDEFQELFMQQDSIAEKADSILEQLVRKGRSFGINLLLATQSFGKNSLSSTVRDLINVRTAFMCADNDARLILADNNPAAHLLERPGQGIYNELGGLVEGNKHFQAYYFSDEARTIVLSQLSDYCKDNWGKPIQTKVFRGDQPVLIEANPWVNAFQKADSPHHIYLYLGDSVSMESNVRLTLTRDSGMNVLLIGSDMGAVSRLMVNSLTCIALQQKPVFLGNHLSQFYIMNFSDSLSNEYQIIKNYFDSNAYSFKYVNARQMPTVLEELEAEVQHRINQENQIVQAHQKPSAIYVSLMSLQKYRGFSTANYTLSDDSRRLNYLLKEGPDVGIFVLLHCDTLHNLDQKLELTMLPNCRYRIALPMDLSDMGNILNQTIRTSLRAGRAYLNDNINSELNTIQLYELPNKNWFNKKIN